MPMILGVVLSLVFAAADPTGHWSGMLHGPNVTIEVDLTKNAKGELAGTITNAVQNVHGLPLSNVAVDGDAVTFAIKDGTFHATIAGDAMRGTCVFAEEGKRVELPFELSRAAADPIARWASAVGGREKIAAIQSIYREATVELPGGMQGTIKAWHTPDGKYRKEEQVGSFSTIETFDGTNGSVQQNGAPLHAMSGPELERARSTAYANSNAMFFAFFPERRHGDVAVEDDGTVVLKPAGGIDWRVTLDPQTGLPKTMSHQEGERTVTVTFLSYETVDGIQFEKKIRRSLGDPPVGATIRFTKTVLNPKVEEAMFAPGR